MTFSIVARDPKTGALGVATATAGPLVGVLVPHARRLTGAVATQAMTNPYLALDVLENIETLGAEAALEMALARDPDRDLRQVIAVDAHGATAGWTGEGCEEFAAHLLGSGVAVAGNILTGPPVLEAMMAAYSGTTGPMGERLLAALRSGHAAGGDRRGLGSAAMRIVEREAYPVLDLRIDWSEAPLADMLELYRRATEGAYAQFHAGLPERFSPGRE